MNWKKFVALYLILAIVLDIATVIVSWRLGWATGYEQALNDNGIQIAAPIKE